MDMDLSKINQVDLSKVYNVVLNSKFDNDESLCNQIYDRLKVHYPEAKHLRINSESQIPVFESALNTWRLTPKVSAGQPLFDWPILSYRTKITVSEERDFFVEGFEEIEKFLQILER